MSASIILTMAKGEMAKIKEKIPPTEKTANYNIAAVFGPDKNVGCHIYYKQGGKIQIEYSGGWPDSEWGKALAHQICLSYKVKRGMFDNVGYGEDIKQFKKYRAFGLDIDREKRYYKESLEEPNLPIAGVYKQHLENLKNNQKRYEKAARKLLNARSK